MTRTVSATITSAVGKDVTQPVYLIHMVWDSTSPQVDSYIATWDVAITWNGINWQGSGAEVRRLSAGGGQLKLPNGDTDTWLTLINAQNPQGKAITVYEHHTDATASPQADATLVFSGQMDACTITDDIILIDFIEGLTNKRFPVTSIQPDVYTKLLASGSRLFWEYDIVLVK